MEGFCVNKICPKKDYPSLEILQQKGTGHLVMDARLVKMLGRLR